MMYFIVFPDGNLASQLSFVSPEEAKDMQDELECNGIFHTKVITENKLSA